MTASLTVRRLFITLRSPISSLTIVCRSPSYLALTSGSLGGGPMGVSVRRLLVVISVLCLASMTAFGQFLSGVDGSVRDRTGALVAGANVKITEIGRASCRGRA